ncbi:VOC family protein [Nonomuraea gerenzanensis]|uniref:Glyoxalase/Bleomycin resistance protein/dioxygenase domain n=1 Tax=Nonomuraea gerenzanensis TaxID=93944 RepID=A0A1M4EDW7_9ACTN|nr:VOC family protein [Nonomuraea gerenzanensis]UBU08801.1 VOC family protein [Nonomuraea gerenzanensis]SBO97167.1 Glyoxalase/Bleomycin resistance protein/dioxygenase domain [Nonomuraea gerenzanensis]
MNIVSSAISLTVADPAASSGFFTGHLGFREVLAGEDFIVLGRDDGAVDLILVALDPERWQPGQSLADATVVFSVTGLAAEYERLRAEGAPITAPLRREPWGELVTRLADPNGVTVQLNEWIPPITS